MVLSRTPALWQRRWLAVFVAWIVCLIGWPVVALIPSHYVSETQVYVDTQSLLQPLLSGIAVDIDPNQQVEILKRTLTSRATLERVVKMTTQRDTAMTDSALDQAVNTLRQNLSVRSAQDKTFTISYDSLSANQAYQVVQSTLNLFIESNFGTIRQNLDNAQTFLRDQVAQYDDRVRKAQEALSTFKQNNLDVLNGGNSYGELLGKTRDDVREQSAQLDDLKARAGELRRQLDAEPKYAAASTSTTTSDTSPGLETRIHEVEQRLDSLRTHYTDDHPEVVNTIHLLTNLKAEYAKQQKSAPAQQSMGSNEVYRQVKIQLVDTEAQIASGKNKLERRRTELAALEQQASKMPAIDAELQRLTREFETARANYETLAQRLQAANLSESRENQADKIQFRIIDPPQVPTRPSGIKRSLLLTLVLAGGLALGGTIILILVIMQKTFVDSQHLARVTGYPVVGTVSLARDEREENSHMVKTILFGGLSLGLFIIWGGLMMVERDVGLPALLPSKLRQGQTTALMPLDGMPRPHHTA
ncbi:MAG TPA: XrtA system polysaccharide chain length determinant [Aliidongia sp.]|uniref:XrtA system polysaccharide chain length determinant n=1 Tax=Aliidongia sp. TaxID=1914230 RepID=UPI002DDD559C|nr:XrtA system polysaccharide chain length determinant [Aliidongia sp.]HEV2678766.1 XrtA system polysaccharide chain length determinant [Aliidongia sp.]